MPVLLGPGWTAWARTDPGEHSHQPGGPLIGVARVWCGDRWMGTHTLRRLDTHSPQHANTDLLGHVPLHPETGTHLLGYARAHTQVPTILGALGGTGLAWPRLACSWMTHAPRFPLAGCIQAAFQQPARRMLMSLPGRGPGALAASCVSGPWHDGGHSPVLQVGTWAWVSPFLR